MENKQNIIVPMQSALKAQKGMDILGKGRALGCRG
jgi:hypothetical protein